MKKKKLHFFKNDPFDIKYKTFRKQLIPSIKESITLQTKMIACLLEIIVIIGHPSDDEEFEELKEAVEKYDKNIEKLEGYVARARLYIDERGKTTSDIIDNREE